MFELLVLHDEMIIQPGNLKAFHKEVENHFKECYVNKVISDNGLCVAIKSIVIKDRIVVQGEGSV